jgi:hypothetical protein
MRGNPIYGEIDILLKILKGSAAWRPVSFDAEKLLQLAALHRLNYQLLLYAQAHPGFLAPDQLDGLSSRCRQNAMISLVQLHELIRITGMFREAGIPVVVIKGPQLARMIYGREALKESLDLDILLVHDGELGRSHSLLAGLGYGQSNLNARRGKISRNIFLIGKREVHYINPGNGCHIDLHIRPGANTYLTAGSFSRIFDSLEPYDLEGQPVQVFTAEQYLVYLCYHGALHQFSRLGWLMDIRGFLSVKGDLLDYKRVMSLAREMHAETHLLLTMALLKTYFGDSLPSLIENQLPDTRRFNFLVKACRDMLCRDYKYGFTLQGRARRISYMMVLIRDLPGRVDLLFGIFMRILATCIR